MEIFDEQASRDERTKSLVSEVAASLVGGGDCLAQRASGDATLLSPEPGLFILGMKSYGRASSFLLRLGHQQVEAVIRLLDQ